MTTVKLSEALRKIDLLDGVEDGKYMGGVIDDGTLNTFQACLAKDCVEEAVNGEAEVVAIQDDNSLTPFNCEDLAQRLNLLANIASQLTTTRFTVKLSRGEFNRNNIPSPGDTFVFRAIDLFIGRILRIEEGRKETLSEAFSQLPVEDFVQSIQVFGGNFGKLGDQETMRKFQQFNIEEGLIGAYALFETESRKIGFDPTPFKSPHQKGASDKGDSSGCNCEVQGASFQEEPSILRYLRVRR